MSIFEKLFHTNKENRNDKEDKNMKIAVICANGKAGKLIVKEALDRKLDVTAVVRGENKTEASQVITKDLFDLTAADLKGFDVVIDAFGAWTEDTLPLHSTSLKHLCDILSGTDTRLLVVGGAGSLYVNAEHTAQVMDGPDFPDVFKPLASNMGKALSELRQRKDVRWTYISPAGDFQAEGERTGSYLPGGEELTLNSRGESIISYADYAIAMVDEAVKGTTISSASPWFGPEPRHIAKHNLYPKGDYRNEKVCFQRPCADPDRFRPGRMLQQHYLHL